MTAEQFDIILSRQIPDAEKRARADWVIETTTLADAEAQVDQVLTEIKEILNA
jgi:dephospho-CoA kinase